MPVPNSIDDLSTVPTNNSPSGSEQVFPQLDDYLRMHASCIAQLRDLVSLAAPEVGVVKFWGGVRTYIPKHNLPPDGQILNRADYPKLWELLSAGGLPMITDSAWLATPTKRTSFSSGNGATTFRMPDYNGKSENAIGSVTLRGDGASSAGESGVIQDSQNASHTHTATVSSNGIHTHGVTDSGHTHNTQVGFNNGGDGWGDGAIDTGNAYTFVTAGQVGSVTWSGSNIGIQQSGDHNHVVTIANSGGTEARAKVATGVWVMRVE